MSQNLRGAAAAYDATQADLAGLKGLFTAPHNDRKRELLRERLDAAFHNLVTCRRLLDRADGDERFVIAPTIGSGVETNVVPLRRAAS